MTPTSRIRLVAASVALGIGSLLAGGAFAQPPPGDKDPKTLPLGEIQPDGPPPRPPPPGLPPGHPPMPGQMQPGQLPPGMPAGRPPRPPARPPLRPQLPAAAPHAEEDHKGGHKAEHCPGHGPMDDPHHINWWEGILMVNNEKAQFAKDDHGHLHRTDGFLTRLLYRYENDKDPCDDKNQPPPFLASLINFGLLVFLLYRFGKKPIAEALANRRKEVMGDIDKATQLKREAQERLDEYEEKLRKLDETLEEMRVDHKQQSEAERRQVLAEAEERRVRMKKDVEIRLVQEAKATREELLREAVDAAVIAAEEILRKKVGQADHDRAQDAYLEAVGTIVKSDRSAPSTSAQASGGAS